MVEQLSERAPKNWRKFDAFMDIFFGFMVYSHQEVYTEKDEFDNTSEAYKTGMEIYFKYNMIRYLGDFVLQEKSPYHEEGQQRVSMTAAYGAPNFTAILKTIILMRSD